MFQSLWCEPINEQQTRDEHFHDMIFPLVLQLEVWDSICYVHACKQWWGGGAWKGVARAESCNKVSDPGYQETKCPFSTNLCTWTYPTRKSLDGTQPMLTCTYVFKIVAEKKESKNWMADHQWKTKHFEIFLAIRIENGWRYRKHSTKPKPPPPSLTMGWSKGS